MKDENYWKILNSAVRLDVQKGHLRWTVAELARSSGVGRTLIYYYFGKSKEQVIKTALNIIADEVFGLSPERLQLWKDGRIAESIEKSRALLQLAPQLREFYFHWRYTPSETQDHLIRVEKRYLQKLRGARPNLSPVAAEACFALLFGLVMHPPASPATIHAAVKILETNLDS